MQGCASLSSLLFSTLANRAWSLLLDTVPATAGPYPAPVAELASGLWSKQTFALQGKGLQVQALT